MSHPLYVTKDGKLFEVLGRDVTKNAGLTGGQVAVYHLQDVHSYDDPFTVQESVFTSQYAVVDQKDAELALAPDVVYVEPHPRLLERLHADLDTWAHKRPSWMD